MNARVHATTDPLSEPPSPRVLRVLRRELALSIAPQLQTDRSRGVADLMQKVLDHLIARQENYPELLCHFEDAAQDAASGSGMTAAEVLSESELAELVRRLSADTDATAPLRSALHRLLSAERELHDALERHEQAVATTSLAADEQPTALEAAPLQAYLRRRFAGELDVVDIKTPMGGYSKDTFIVTLHGTARPADGIVIRCDLPGGPLETTAVSEFGVLKAMHMAGVPVAEPLWAEADGHALGRPFIAVRQVAGKQPMGMTLEFTGEDAPAFARQLARVLAQVHQVDPRAAGLDEGALSRSTAAHIVDLLDQYEEQWRRRRLGPSPTMTAGLQWMRHNIPCDLPAPRIVHGDATLRNMLFEHGRATALLDWETWHLGDPGEDLAYCRDEVERFLPWQDFLAEYRDAGGTPPSAEVQRYWGMWMYLRGAVTSVSQMDRLLDDPPPDIRPAFGGPHFTRYCVRKVAEYLLANT